jgi:hypothetical protein
VGRSVGIFHATVLLVVAMLAWPWNVALTALEGAHAAPHDGSVIQAKRLSAPGRRVSRPTRWTACTPPLLQAATEQGEEGDDTCPPQSGYAWHLETHGPTPPVYGVRPAREGRTPLDRPSGLFGRLRC